MFNFLCALIFCSISSTYGHDDTKRILDGWNVTEGKSYPYYALIYLSGTPHSGGTVIKENVILTAASVVSGYQPSALKVYPGVSKLSEVSTSTAHSVKSIKVDEDYKYGNASHDVALLFLTSNVTFVANRVDKISLTDMRYDAGSVVTIVGFGLTNCSKLEYNSAERVEKCVGQASDRLRVGHLVVTRYDGNVMVTNNSFATIGPCYGDFGGPVVYDNRLVGIQSLIQKPNCTGESYQVSVDKVRSWITSKIA